MDEQLHNTPLNFSCKQDWGSMQPVPGGRYCHSCQKKVHDFRDKDAAYFMKILAGSDYSACGRFRPEQLPAVPVQRPYWQKWAVAALVFAGLSTFMEKAKAQLTGKVSMVPPPSVTDTAGYDIMGMVAVLRQPEYPGGRKALGIFLRRNFRMPVHVPDGRLSIGFVVRKDGSLTGIHIVQGLTAALDKEAVRVMRLSPRWEPPYTGNPGTDAEYVLPVTFRSGKIVMP